MNSDLSSEATIVDYRDHYERFPDVMADWETTGTNKAHNAIIQMAAVRFNLAERTIDTSTMFNRSLSIPENRFWMESTRDWWLRDKRDILMDILAKGESPRIVLQAFQDWLAVGNAVMWAKPTHFDFSFLEAYCADYGFGMPFHFRTANDMNSFIRARYFPEPEPGWERKIEFQGPAHNALFDCIHQIRVLFAVMDDTEVSSKGNFDAEDAPF